MEDLVIESLKFMVLGMGIVFVLLLFIVFLTNLQAKIVSKFFPDKVAKDIRLAESSKTTTANSDGALIAAITVAVAEYKK